VYKSLLFIIILPKLGVNNNPGKSFWAFELKTWEPCTNMSFVSVGCFLCRFRPFILILKSNVLATLTHGVLFDATLF